MDKVNWSFEINTLDNGICQQAVIIWYMNITQRFNIMYNIKSYENYKELKEYHVFWNTSKNEGGNSHNIGREYY